jgi:hypothetical protein
MAYSHFKAHNMLVIMLDLCYKNNSCIWEFLGGSIIAKIVAKYDIKIMCPLLLQVYNI